MDNSWKHESDAQYVMLRKHNISTLRFDVSDDGVVMIGYTCIYKGKNNTMLFTFWKALICVNVALKNTALLNCNH